MVAIIILPIDSDQTHGINESGNESFCTHFDYIFLIHKGTRRNHFVSFVLFVVKKGLLFVDGWLNRFAGELFMQRGMRWVWRVKWGIFKTPGKMPPWDAACRFVHTV